MAPPPPPAATGDAAVGARLARAAGTSASVALQDVKALEEAASSLLNALRAAYSEADFQAEIARLREVAEGDDGKFLGLLGPVATRVQTPIFERFGLPSGRRGVPLMKTAVKRIGKECPAVARLAGDLRELLLLPREEPDFGGLLAALGQKDGGEPPRREQEELDEKIQKWIGPTVASQPSRAPCGAAAAWAAAKVQFAALRTPADSKNGAKIAQAVVYAANNACVAVRLAAIEGAKVPREVVEWSELCKRCLACDPRALAELTGQRGRELLERVAPALARLPGPAPPRLRAAPATPSFDGRGEAVMLGGSVRMPLVGFGTWRLSDSMEPGEIERQSYDLVREALKAGYRHLDCAIAYANEAAVGRAIEESGIPREELFIATKFSNFLPGMTHEVVEETFAQQLKALRVRAVDLYILHHCPSSHEQLLPLWRAFERLHVEGKVRALGVSNFSAEELERLLRDARVKPVYLQNKLSVYFPGEQLPRGKRSLLDVCREGGVHFMAYSCVNGWPAVLPPAEDPHVQRIAARLGCKPAQVLIRWALRLGAGVLVRTRKPQRMPENLAAQDLRLSEEDMQLLSGLAQLHHSTAAGLAPAFIAGDAYGLRPPA